MKQEILKFIEENELSPFNQSKTQIKPVQSIYKTTDAKKVHNRTLQTISKNFIFPDTANILHFFTFTNNPEKVIERQNFFRNILESKIANNDFLNEIRKPKKWWKPRYDVVVVTEDSETFTKLKSLDIPVQLLVSEQDVVLLESRDVVQVIDCPDFGMALESLPQAVFLKSLDQVYLERHLETFSGWIEIIKLLKNNPTIKSIQSSTEELYPLIELTNDGESNSLDPDEIEGKIIDANEIIQEKIKELNIQGMELIQILSKGILPEEIKNKIDETIEELEIPRQVLEVGIPLKLDEEELQNLINKQNSNEFSELAEEIKEHSGELKEIPKRLSELSSYLLFFDFISGISKFVKEDYFFPHITQYLNIENTNNIFLENPQPISFNLKEGIQCSILTGANSGGKTTLIEHTIQLISLAQLGLPTSGKNEIPLFEEIYYFAKNKGSNLKGAFETLLTQMSKIKPGNKTIILADEIEAVTEPGVAGNIIAATADYYIKQNCYLIIATHLGHEIEKILPEKTRIDGIEATGLTEDFELLVNHNPVLGRLAHSTPELIVEKMANKEQKDYFIFLNRFLKKSD
jgi:DNA mismatch repair protein MutS2